MKGIKLYIFGLLIVPIGLTAQILTFNNTNPSPEGGFYSFTVDSFLGYQDYIMDSTLVGNDTCYVDNLNFVGGLETGGTLRVRFLREDSSLVSSWDYTLQPGIFNYDLNLPDVPIPLRGIICVESPNGSGRWYYNFPQFQIGSQDTMSTPKINGQAIVHSLGIECAGTLNCPEYVNHNELITPGGNYVAEKQIVSISTIEQSSQVTLDAAVSTKLGPYFEVELGAILEVLTDGCIP